MRVGEKLLVKQELQLKEFTISKLFSINVSYKCFMWLGPISQQPPTTAAPWFAQFRAWLEYSLGPKSVLADNTDTLLAVFKGSIDVKPFA